MTEQAPCSCGQSEKIRLIFPCSGQANTGQISNQAAIQLSDEGYGSFVCTALLASGSESLAERGREVQEVVAIDGCGMKCARKIVEQAGVPVHQHLVVTELGVTKNSADRTFTKEQVECIVSAAWKGEGKNKESDTEKKNSSGGCGCGGNCV
ncbi:MAG TPA: putative zinc-binding protein [Methanospirillum sp.]|uniref:putative zinc-binding protein n=1 Tax=Methanospirillum sp. TaxID=45200 RepID=UPI002CEAA9AD|nr:putative zinc-binding protein [Methanospirillum sp.]HOJ95375.1 putative zinc-binding protein [Methanospirillum sp.]HOL41573.1 putative zinc-binding protein [Methanospirillum sp.]HPP76856.1 putative zinc-binding protein [Methanospirillum sp.]